ncbi:MAG TPA: hypothetical protein VKH41_12080 [Myxococcota bacterium]|nr:hypothetical protein [Myxococcota bacterium]
MSPFLIAALFCAPALADGPVLILSAYSPEGTLRLQTAGVDGPEDQVGVFNRRPFLAGRIGSHDVVLGLTGIGLVDAHNTTAAALAFFRDHGLTPKAIVFSGVAGGPDIGDVVVPDRWTDGDSRYPVDACMFSVAQGLRRGAQPVPPRGGRGLHGARVGAFEHADPDRDRP